MVKVPVSNALRALRKNTLHQALINQAHRTDYPSIWSYKESLLRWMESDVALITSGGVPTHYDAHLYLELEQELLMEYEADPGRISNEL